MGQLFVVHGAEAETRRALFRRGLERFEALCGQKPIFEAERGHVSVAKFGRLHAASRPAVEQGARWLAGAGTWFHRGGQDDLELLAEWRELIDRDRPFENLGEHLDGSFVIALADADKDELSLITDRIGTLACYETKIDGCRLFCTSSLVLAALARRAWDLFSVREFLATGTVFAQRSLFDGIDKLEPATVLHLSGGETRAKARYFSLAEVDYDDAPMAAKAKKIADALEQSISTIVEHYPRARVDLTGGLDSRAVLGALLRTSVDFETVVNGADEDPDVKAARVIAATYDLRHQHRSLPENWGEVWWDWAKRSLALTDGEHGVLEYAGVHYFQHLGAENYEVSINGSGGEVAKGYWWELLLPFVGSKNPRHFNAERVAAKRFAFDPWSEGLLRQNMPDSLAAQLGQTMTRYNRELEGRPNTAKLDNVYIRLRMQRWQGRLASATNRLLPNVSPFLFGKPLLACLSARPALRFNEQLPRAVIECLDPGLAALPLAEGYPALPIRADTLHHFGPLARQLAKKVRRKALPSFLQGSSKHEVEAATDVGLSGLMKNEEVLDLLDTSQMKTAELYHAVELEKHISQWRSGAQVSSYHLERVLTLELLARATQG